jgi:hypothetical protein
MHVVSRIMRQHDWVEEVGITYFVLLESDLVSLA